jgi:pimeloyl-ACP methyl ester carboxylesterase
MKHAYYTADTSQDPGADTRDRKDRLMTEKLILATGAGSVTGFFTAGDAGRPLLVCIPGGSYNVRYFDVPRHSFVQAAIDRRFPIAALNRPGYEDSTPLPAPTFAGNAAAITRPSTTCGPRTTPGTPGWF